MKVAMYGTKSYDIQFFDKVGSRYGHEMTYIEGHLNKHTASLAKGHDAVCAFVNDNLSANCMRALADNGIFTVAMRCAGFNNVDLEAAEQHGITVVRVPEYSPHGVAEHAVALLLSLNRKLYKSYNRVRDNNFVLDGLLGFNVNSRTVGVIGTGRIGMEFAKIMRGFGCEVIAYDLYPNQECIDAGVEYTELDDLFARADIISLHCPLTPDTHHLIDDVAIEKMKQGVMIINTSRGALVDTVAVIYGLKSGRIGYLGLDVYEEEADIFFEDISNRILEDDVFARLLTFPNVEITGHQAYFTSDALEAIADVTLSNLTDIEQGRECPNVVTA